MLCDPNWASNQPQSPTTSESAEAIDKSYFKREIHLEEQEECEPVFQK